MDNKVYRHLDKLPSGRASGKLTHGCIVLEGGGWKGLYTLGVLESMEKTNSRFNEMVDMLEEKSARGEIFLIAPSKPVTVSRFDGDMDRLGALYRQGYRDMKSRLDLLKDYLK